MYYLDLTFHSTPSEIRGVSIETQSMDTAVRRMQDWINGYTFAADVGTAPPEIEKISKSKTRGIEYTRLEDLR